MKKELETISNHWHVVGTLKIDSSEWTQNVHVGVVSYVRKILRTYVEHAQCECGGELTFVGMGEVSVSGTPNYPHVCSNCMCVVGLSRSYPRQVQEEQP